MDAWLYFIASDRMEDVYRVMEKYPEFWELYEEVFQFRFQKEELIGMYSDALRILDENTVQYMVEEQQEMIEAQRRQLAQNEEQMCRQSKQLSEQEQKLSEQSKELSEQSAVIGSQANVLEQQKKEIEYLRKLLAERG